MLGVAIHKALLIWIKSVPTEIIHLMAYPGNMATEHL